MDYKNLIDTLIYEEEGNALDFKREQYAFQQADDGQKSELLKDILAFANSWRRSEAYIVIGVKEVKGGPGEIIGISTTLDDANIQQFINSKVQRPIEFSYKNIQYNGVQIAIICIPVQERPFYLKKDFGSLKGGQVYVRRGSSTDIAFPDEIAKMGREFHGAVLGQPSLEAFLIYGEHDEFITKNAACEITLSTIPQDEEFPHYGGHTIDWGGRYQTYMPDMTKNKNYYKQLAKYWQARLRVQKFKLGIKNSGQRPAIDVKILIDIMSDQKISFIGERTDLPAEPSESFVPFTAIHSGRVGGDISVKNIQTGWRVICQLGKIQPQETAVTEEGFYIGTSDNATIHLKGQIFSDDLAKPKDENFDINFKVKAHQFTVNDFIPKED